MSAPPEVAGWPLAPAKHCLAEQSVGSGETFLDLVIDSAGKVRSAELAGKTPDPDLVHAAMQWTFIPALKNGHAVASRTRLAISTRR